MSEREPRYTLFDFTETLTHSDVRGQIEPTEIEKVLAVWGDNDDGWSGGFLLRMRDGRIAYVSGWCDYTGWGCQDGAGVQWRENDDLPVETTGYPAAHVQWDRDPADLNGYIARGMPESERFG